MGKVKISTVLDNLKFDGIQINTKQAEDYIKTYGGIFKSINFELKNTITKTDYFSNSIECADSSEFLLPDTLTLSTTESWTIITNRLKNLATRIKEKSSLFCQLEWLIRQIPIETTQQSVDLIVKNVSHASGDWKAAYIEEGVIAMADRTPMLILGFLAQIFKTCDDPIILSTPQTAVICHLFTEVCREVGWNVRLILIDQLNNLKDIEQSHKIYPNLFNGLLPEVTGIITERSDLDSAVDIFLNTGFHPLPITRLLVQESILEDFQNNLEWKCKSSKEEIGEEEIVKNCSNAFKYNDKLFLFNYTGNHVQQGSHHVLVEAFRTVREVLSLVRNYKQLCLSLWASSISEANEIALNVNVPIIWINDYCNFTGCDEVTKSIYKRIDSVNMSVKMNSSIVKLINNQGNWSKKTFTERCDSVLKAIKCNDLSLGDKVEAEISNWKINNFITINNDTIILGFNIPDKIVLYNTFGAVAVPSPGFDNIIRALINGSGVIIASKPKNEEEIFVAFETEGIPVAFIDEEETDELEELQVPLGDSWCFQTKVIWTTFGTTFAN